MADRRGSELVALAAPRLGDVVEERVERPAPDPLGLWADHLLVALGKLARQAVHGHAAVAGGADQAPPRQAVEQSLRPRGGVTEGDQQAAEHRPG